MYFYKIVVTILISIVATTSMAAYEQEELLQQLSPHSDTIELSENAVIINNNWVIKDELIDMDTFRAHLVLKRNDTTEAIKQGDILLSSGEQGLLDEVLVAELQNDTILLETKPADLFDAVKEIQISQ